MGKPSSVCLFSSLVPITSLFVIPFLSVLSAFDSFILVYYFFLFLYTLFVYSRFLPFSPFDLSVRLVQCLFLTPHSWQQCCCIATDKSQNSALFIPAQPLVNKRVFCVTKDLRRSTVYRDERYHELPPSPQANTMKQDKNP